MKKNLSVWNIDYEEFPFDGDVLEQIKFLLQYAILAPSTHNVQPWKFKIEDRSCIFFLEESIELKYGDPEKRYAYISIGAALENFLLASKVYGMQSTVEYFCEGGGVARVVLEKSSGIEKKSLPLLKSITNRVNVRGIFKQKKLPQNFISELQNISKSTLCTVHVSEDLEMVEQMAHATAEGLKKAHADKMFRKEISQYIKSNISSSDIGIPGYTMNLPLVPSLIAPWLISKKDISKILSKLNYKSIVSSSVVCVCTVPDWEPRNWVDVGQCAQRIVLYAQEKDIFSSVYVAATQFPETSKKIQTLFNTKERPVFFFCMGYMDRVFKHAPRIPLSKKIIT